MRLAELSEATGETVATLKYYMREGLLPPGTPVTKTRADYGEEHVARVRLIRALSEQGGLSLSRVHRILSTLEEEPVSQLHAVEAAQRSLLLEDPEDGTTSDFPAIWPVDPTTGEPVPVGVELYPDTPAGAWLRERGWLLNGADPALESFDAAWRACVMAGLDLSPDRLSAYADAMELIARVDLDAVPDDPHAALRNVLLGTILVEPLLVAMRAMALQHTAVHDLLNAAAPMASRAVPPA